MATIDKRVRKNKDGKTITSWRARYSNAEGKRVERMFDTRKDAVVFTESLSVNRSKKREKLEDLDTSPTFADVAEAFISACEKGRNGGMPLEPLTIKGYRQILMEKVAPLFGSKAIASITRQDIKEARDILVERSIRDSARKHLKLLKACFMYAVDEEIIASAPIQAVGIAKDQRGGTEDTVVKTHSLEDMIKIMAAAKRLQNAPYKKRAWERYGLMLQLLVNYGLRASELRGLPRRAVDLEAKTIKVLQRANLESAIGAPKSALSRRTIYIADDVCELLAAWIENHVGDNPDELVFGTDGGKPISHQNLVKRMWNVVQDEAGVPHLGLHSTRHFYASSLIRDKVDFKMLQISLGHSDPMFTMRVYGHLFTDQATIALRRAMSQRMSNLFADKDEDED